MKDDFCPVCDRRFATLKEHNAWVDEATKLVGKEYPKYWELVEALSYPDHLCFFGKHQYCRNPPVDWRIRALEAEKELRRLKE